jgi:lipoate-protein ligase A
LGPNQVAAIGNRRNDRRRPEPRQVKIREGVYVLQNMLKTPGGLIRVTAVNKDGKLHDVHISGDFFFYPAEDLPALECALDGVQANCRSVTEKVVQFYARQKVDSPGVQPEDFTHVLVPNSV